MRYLLIAAVVVFSLAFVDTLASAYSCEQVRNAVRALTKEQLEDIMKHMTPEEIAAAKRCLKGS